MCKHENALEDGLHVVLESASVPGPVGGGVPDRILIVPWGEVRSDSGSFLLDEEAAAAAMTAFNEHGADLPVDFEHQTLGGAFSSPSGQAPAAGWVNALIKVSPEEAGRDGLPAEPGLWGNVTWTGDGAERLTNREYRYLSPVALVRRRDRRLIALHSAALTNKPAIVGMRPIINRSAAAVPQGVRSAGGSDEVGMHIAALKIALSLEEAVDAPVVLRSAVARIRELENTERRRSAEERVAAAMSAGKLAACQKEWAVCLALRDPGEFDRWEADAPILVTPGRLGSPADPQSGKSANHRAQEALAREEWRANRAFLEKLCGEDAYVATAVRGVSSF